MNLEPLNPIVPLWMLMLGTQLYMSSKPKDKSRRELGAMIFIAAWVVNLIALVLNK